MEEPFSIQSLSEHQLGCVEFVLNSPAYVEVFKPYLEEARNVKAHMMLDRSTARKEQYPDDYLAGGICTIDDLLVFFGRVLDETRMERVHEAQGTTTPAVEYHRLQQNGGLSPVLGANQQTEATEYSAEIDY